MSGRPSPVLALLGALLLASACAQRPLDSQTSSVPLLPTMPPTGSSSPVPTASASAAAAARPPDTGSPTELGDPGAARPAGEQLPPASAAPRTAAATSSAVDYTDPSAVAAAYVTTRLTYRYDDPEGYRAALRAPAYTTPAFADRSEPPAAALARLATAQESSAVRVGAAELEGEAPHTATTRYVSVAVTTTTTYRGGGGTAAGSWTVRLVQVSPGQWRVDGVLSTG